MKKILFIVQKEFLQIFRDRFMVILIFAMPIVQLTVLAFAATYEIKNLRIHIVDMDRSPASKKLISKLDGSNYFNISSYSFNMKKSYAMLELEKADLVLRIGSGFEKELTKYGTAQVQVFINAINGTKAALASVYINSAIKDFYKITAAEKQAAPNVEVITIDYRNWYNPGEDFKTLMVPGILAVLITLISMLLTALNIVREKEIGTIEQLNVTTIKKHEFIIGKLIPFGLLAITVFALGLLVAKFIFQISIEGSLWLLFSYAVLYIITAMGLGTFLSNISSSQQQAIFTSFFFAMIFILMSGLFTPIESMPDWAQKITIINPLSYFIKFMRMVMLKGSSFSDTKDLFPAIGIYAVAVNSLAVVSYKKTK